MLPLGHLAWFVLTWVWPHKAEASGICRHQACRDSLLILNKVPEGPVQVSVPAGNAGPP